MGVKRSYLRKQNPEKVLVWMLPFKKPQQAGDENLSSVFPPLFPGFQEEPSVCVTLSGFSGRASGTAYFERFCSVSRKIANEPKCVGPKKITLAPC